MLIQIAEKSIVYVLKTDKSVERNAVVQIVEINNKLRKVFLFRKKEMLAVIVKKVNVQKNIVNVMLMVSNVGNHVIVHNVKTVEMISNYFLLL